MNMIGVLILCLSVFVFNFLFLVILGGYLIYQIWITKNIETKMTGVYESMKREKINE